VLDGHLHQLLVVVWHIPPGQQGKMSTLAPRHTSVTQVSLHHLIIFVNLTSVVLLLLLLLLQVPQEKVPADVAAKVTAEMLDAFSSLLGPAAGTVPKAVFTRCDDREAAHDAGLSCEVLEPFSQLM
jgi:hypothetical protein